MFWMRRRVQNYSCVDLRILVFGEGRGEGKGDVSRWGGEKRRKGRGRRLYA